MKVVFTASYIAYWVGVADLSGLAIAAFFRPMPAGIRRAVPLVAALGVLTLVVRTVYAGHAPIFGTFENTLSCSVALMIGAALTSRHREAPGAWMWALPWAVVLLIYGTFFRIEAVPLTISEQSLWVDAHALLAWAAFVPLILASTLALYRVRGVSFWDLSAEEGDEYIGRLLNFGFLGLTVMMIVGSWYLYLLFGVFWKWEIVETMALVGWLGYALVIHARYFYRLSGRAFGAAVLAVLPALILTFWVWSLFPNTFHYFDIPLMRPY